jgi:hypothetical protein
MMNRYKLRILLSVLLVGLVSVIAIAIEYHHKKPAPVVKKTVLVPIKEPEIQYDPVLLSKFKELTQELDFAKPHCTYAGTINIIDGKDSASTVLGIKFLFCRANKDFYYQVANTETIHQNGINVFIQHEQGKVVLSDQDMPLKSPVINLEELQKKLQYESYHLTSKMTGNSKVLSLLNDTHVTCKEISITYDTLSNKIEKLNTRLSDFSDPLNKKKDRLVELLITRVEDTGRLSKYPSVNDVVYQEDGKWKLTAKYAKYELIIL